MCMQRNELLENIIKVEKQIILLKFLNNYIEELQNKTSRE